MGGGGLDRDHGSTEGDEWEVAKLYIEHNATDEYSVDNLRADFPEGEYTVTGTDYDGVARAGTARFTHAIPTAPEINDPTLAEDAETANVASLSVPAEFPRADTIHELEVLALEDSGNQTISVGLFRTEA